MNADDLEMARRFVACKGWVWLEGMVACDSSRPLMWRRRLLSQCEIFGWKFDAVSGPVPRGPWRSLMGWSPDLSDALTRAGLLEVVRRAWGMPHCGLWGNSRLGLSLRWACGEANGRIFTGETELAALLAALEAAPGV